MSRNLSDCSCAFCRSEVRLDEPARPITRDEAGPYYDIHEGYGYAGGLFANATCILCGAKYLAWVDLSACAGYGPWERDRHDKDRPFHDLSHRAAFNDEPAEDDLPDWRIETLELTPKQCEALEAIAGKIERRHPWPRCPKTGRKVWYGYGCPCDEHRGVAFP